MGGTPPSRRSGLSIAGAALLLFCCAALFLLGDDYSPLISSPAAESFSFRQLDDGTTSGGGPSHSYSSSLSPPSSTADPSPPEPTVSSPPLLAARLERNPSPRCDWPACKTCSTSYDPDSERWVESFGVQPPPLPGSKLAIGNDFATKLTSSFGGLRVLVVGDSIGDNVAHFLEMAHGLTDVRKRIEHSVGINRGGREQAKIWVSPVGDGGNEGGGGGGGGYVAFARVLRLWTPANVGPDFLQWDPSAFETFVTTYGRPDVLIYRTPWPWLEKLGGLTGKFTVEDYGEVLRTAHEAVRPRLAVIFATTPVNNNGIADGFVSLRRDNDVLRRFVAEYGEGGGEGRGRDEDEADDAIRSGRVLLLDFEALTDSMVVSNAEAMGIPPSMAFRHVVTGDGLTKLASPDDPLRTGRRGKYKYPQLTAMACGGRSPPDHPERVPSCMDDVRGRISPDGMHFCAATVGPRLSGGVACLIGCAVAADGQELGQVEEEDGPARKRRTEGCESLKRCQDECNGLYMNLDTVFVEDDVGGHLERPGPGAEGEMREV